MIGVSGPFVVSASSLTGPVCITVTGAAGATTLEILSGPRTLRLRKSPAKPNTYCLHIPAGFTGTIEYRYGDVSRSGRAALIVRP